MNHQQRSILIAPYPFKGTYGSREAAEAIAVVIAELGVDIHVLPLGDGGAGTLDSLLADDAGVVRASTVTTATGERLPVEWGRRVDGRAVIEAARVIGLASLPPENRRPLDLSTRGIGELVVQAAQEGAREFWIGLGDTATHDCGIGMASALGFRFFDAAGRMLVPTGRAIPHVRSIDRTGASPLLDTIRVTALCDVLNPLVGPEGAAHRFLGQKGGTANEIELMEEGALRLMEIIRRDLGIDLTGLDGAGAAGGLGAGIAAFLGGRLAGGAARVLDAIGLDGLLASVDLVSTGEGRIDRGTLLGKGTATIVERARNAGVAAIIVAGSIEGERAELQQKLGATIITLSSPEDSAPGTIESVGPALREAVMRRLKT